MAKTSKSSRPAATADATHGQPASARAGAGKGNGQEQDAAALLEADHRKVEGLFKQFEGAGEAQRKQELARQICRELIVHSRLEEEIFYPACREKDVEAEALDEAQVEHDLLKVLVGDLMGREPDSEFFDAKVSVLSEYVRHHVQEEEKPFSGILAKARQGGVDLDELGKRLQERKQQLMTGIESGEIRAPAPRSIRGATDHSNRNREETNMAREFDRDRDDDRGFGPEDGRGRFSGRYTREQDDRTGGRQFGRGGYTRNEGMGGTRDSYEYDRGRGYGDAYRGPGGGRYESEYFESRGRDYRDREFGGRQFGGRGGYDDDRGGRGDYGRGRDYYGSGSAGGGMSGGRFGGGGYSGSDDYSRGMRGGSGAQGSFERENDDYRRGMGNQDRGRMGAGRSGRDEDYNELGRRSRFGSERGNDRNDQGRPRNEEDDFGYMSGGRSGGWRDRD
jgi:hypothetical protein